MKTSQFDREDVESDRVVGTGPRFDGNDTCQNPPVSESDEESKKVSRSRRGPKDPYPVPNKRGEGPDRARRVES